MEYFVFVDFFSIFWGGGWQDQISTLPAMKYVYYTMDLYETVLSPSTKSSLGCVIRARWSSFADSMERHLDDKLVNALHIYCRLIKTKSGYSCVKSGSATLVILVHIWNTLVISWKNNLGLIVWGKSCARSDWFMYCFGRAKFAKMTPVNILCRKSFKLLECPKIWKVEG